MSEETVPASKTPKWDAANDARRNAWAARYGEDVLLHHIAEVRVEPADEGGVYSPGEHYVLGDQQDGSALAIMRAAGLLGPIDDGVRLALSSFLTGRCADNGACLPGMAVRVSVEAGSRSDEDVAALFEEHGINKLEPGNRGNPECHAAIHKLFQLFQNGGTIEVLFS